MLVRIYRPNRNEKGELEGMDIQLCVDFESKIAKIDFNDSIEYNNKKYLYCVVKDEYYYAYYALSDELEEAFKRQKGDI